MSNAAKQQQKISEQQKQLLTAPPPALSEEALGLAVLQWLHSALPKYCRCLSRAKHDAAALTVHFEHAQQRAALGLWDNLASPLLLLISCERLAASMEYLRTADATATTTATGAVFTIDMPTCYYCSSSSGYYSVLAECAYNYDSST